MQNASSTRFSTKETYDYLEHYGNNYTCARAVHHSLHGDPTLRLHPVAPATALVATPENGHVRLDWTASADPDVSGYHIYRASHITNVFTRLNAEPVSGTTYIDTTARSPYTWMP